MRALVTGANGFLGRHVVSALLARGIRGALAGWDLDAHAQLPWSSLPGAKVIERARA